MRSLYKNFSDLVDFDVANRWGLYTHTHANQIQIQIRKQFESRNDLLHFMAKNNIIKYIVNTEHTTRNRQKKEAPDFLFFFIE